MKPQRRRAGAQASQLRRQKRSYLAKTLVLLIPVLIVLVVASVLALETGEVERPIAPTRVEISQEFWWLVMEEMDWSFMPAAILESSEGDPVLRATLEKHGLAFEDFVMTSRSPVEWVQVQEVVVAPAPKPPDIDGDAAYSEAAIEVLEMGNVSLKARVKGVSKRE